MLSFNILPKFVKCRLITGILHVLVIILLLQTNVNVTTVVLNLKDLHSLLL
jgi:hypothetical protein